MGKPPFTTYPAAPAPLVRGVSGHRSPEFAALPTGQTAPATVSVMRAPVLPVTELLVDPITRKEYKIPSPYADELLKLGAWGKLKLSLKQSFVTLPKTIYHGLRGDAQFTLSNFLQVATIPYYLGGAVLAASFRAGRDKLSFSRQGVGVGLYYLGVMLAGSLINGFYKLKTGLDLNQRYRKANGDIEKVFASVDFPRLDLLDERDYARLGRRLGVPNNVADPKREVNDQIHQIISAARTDKLILGNLLAALGAGYFAHSNGWIRLGGLGGHLKAIWRPGLQNPDGLLDRVQRSGQAFRAAFGPALAEKLLGTEDELRRVAIARKSMLGGMALLSGAIVAHSWLATTGRKRKRYESPFNANLSPALSPEQSRYTAALQQHLPGGVIDRLPRKAAFDLAERIESTSLASQIPPVNGGAS